MDAASFQSSPRALPFKRRGKMRGRNKLFLIIFSLFLMGLLRNGFIFVIVALLPSIVIYLLDRSVPQYMFKTVFACNLAAMVPSLVTMISMGPNSTVLQEIMSDALNWFTIYSAAIGGLVLVQIMPILAHSMIQGLHHAQIFRLNQNQQRIEKEWGHEVTQFSNPEGITQQLEESPPAVMPTPQGKN